MKGFIEDSGTCCFIVILGAIRKYKLMVRMVCEDSVKFFQVSAGMCFCLGVFLIGGLLVVF